LRRPHSAAIIQLPRRRILILIVAAFSFRSPRYNQPSGGHMTAEGNHFVAQEIFPVLMER
jgi:hypothetical protein